MKDMVLGFVLALGLSVCTAGGINHEQRIKKLEQTFEPAPACCPCGCDCQWVMPDAC